MPPVNPRFTLTPAIVRDLATIEGVRVVLDLRPLSLGAERRLRHEARVRVAHNSTWIENRTLSLNEARRILENHPDQRGPKRVRESSGRAEIELRNYWSALDFIDRHAKTPLTEGLVRRMHGVIMRGTRGAGRAKDASPYRMDNLQVGRLEYLPPEHQDVPRLMREFVAWLEAVDAQRELPGPVVAAIAAYRFVTIHPFEDGNGRTCRALATLLLKRLGYGLKGLASVESFYTADLARYYGSLQMGLHHNYYESNAKGSRSDPDLTPWIAYFLEMFAKDATKMRATVEHEARAGAPGLRTGGLEKLPRQVRQILAEIPQLDAEFTPTDVAGWFGVSGKTAREWLGGWCKEGHVEPAVPGMKRVRRYRVTDTLRLGFADPEDSIKAGKTSAKGIKKW